MYYLFLVFIAFSALLQGENTGFSSTSFWSSMEWKRDVSELDFQEDCVVQKAEKNFIEFCRKFEGSKLLNYNIPPSRYSIPPIIHFIWLGSSLPPKATAAIESWKEHHQGWEIKIWTDAEAKVFSWTNNHSKFVFEQAESWAEKADVLRLDILYQFGGVYSDVDVFCLHSFHDLIVQEITFFSCFELNYTSRHYGEAFYVGTAVMGAMKGSPIMKYCLDHCKAQKEAQGVGILKRTGPGLVSKACQLGFGNPEEHILILPCSYLYPFPWKRRNENSKDFISPESLAIHLWNNSWM